MSVGDRRAWVRDVSLTAGLSLFYALLGPFGTNTIPLQQRLIEDFALGFACMALLWPPMRLLLRLGDRAGLPELFVLIGGLILLTIPVTLVSIPILGLFQPPIPKGQTPSLVIVYFLVLTMTLPGGVAYMMIERRLLNRRPAAVPSPDAPLPEKTPPWLSPRLGPSSPSRARTTTCGSTRRSDPNSCSCACATRSRIWRAAPASRCIAPGGWPAPPSAASGRAVAASRSP